MSTIGQKNFLSPQSVVAPYLEGAPTERVGKINQLDLPLVNIAAIGRTFGKQIARGNCGVIHRVVGCTPPRIYKIISQEKLGDGDEIRISQRAAEIGVAPAFYSAFVIKQRDQNLVCIEMDDAGKSLGKWMEDLAKNEVDEEPWLTAQEKAYRELEAKKTADPEASFIVYVVPTKNRVNMAVAIDKLYPSRDSFYRALFERIKTLAENKISYTDFHVGNIMPNIDSPDKGLQLIDFDTAHLASDERRALADSINGLYTRLHYENFKELPNKSDESKSLLNWYQNKLGF